MRNWATFGLGSMRSDDTPAVRDALGARLSDADCEVRGEAMVGLAERGVRGAIPAVLAELALTGSTLSIQAAAAFADPIFLPELDKLLASNPNDVDLQEARSKCAHRVVDLIELHDSVAELRREASSIVVDLKPAYVHHWENDGSSWVGTGRTQDARIEIASPAGAVAAFGLSEISGGSLRVSDRQFDLIPAPLDAAGQVTTRIELVDGTSVTIEGAHVLVELVGTSEDIEPLPPEWAPDAT